MVVVAGVVAVAAIVVAAVVLVLGAAAVEVRTVISCFSGKIDWLTNKRRRPWRLR